MAERAAAHIAHEMGRTNFMHNYITSELLLFYDPTRRRQ